jgi:hypothetical protein
MRRHGRPEMGIWSLIASMERSDLGAYVRLALLAFASPDTDYVAATRFVLGNQASAIDTEPMA